MKISSTAAVCASFLAASLSLTAAGFIDNFENPIYPAAGGNLDGVNGWSVDVLGDGGGFLAIMGTITPSPPGPLSPAGTIGGLNDIPAGAAMTATVSRSAALPLANSALGLTFSINPSSVDFPGRDPFSFGVTGAGGANLFSINLLPASGGITVDRYQVTYTFGAAANMEARDPNGDLMFIDEGGTYDISILTALAGADVVTFVEFDGSNDRSFSATGTGLGSANIENFGVTWEVVDGGDNFIAFDNIALLTVPVPEPSTMVLGLLSGFALLRRRRH